MLSLSDGVSETDSPPESAMATPAQSISSASSTLASSTLASSTSSTTSHATTPLAFTPLVHAEALVKALKQEAIDRDQATRTIQEQQQALVELERKRQNGVRQLIAVQQGHKERIRNLECALDRTMEEARCRRQVKNGLHQQIKLIRHEVDAARITVRLQVDTIAMLRAERDEAMQRATASAESAEQVARFQEERDEAVSQVTQVASERDEAIGRAIAMENGYQQALTMLAAERDHTAQTARELQHVINRDSEEQRRRISELEGELTACQREAQGWRAEAERLQGANRVLQEAALQHGQAVVNEARSQMQAQEATMQEMQRQRDSALHQAQAAIADRQSLEETLRQRVAQVDTHLEEITRMQIIINAGLRENRRLETQSNELRQERDSVTQDLEKAQGNQQAETIKRLFAVVEDLQQHLSQSQRNAEQLRVERDENMRTLIDERMRVIELEFERDAREEMAVDAQDGGDVEGGVGNDDDEPESVTDREDDTRRWFVDSEPQGAARDQDRRNGARENARPARDHAQNRPPRHANDRGQEYPPDNMWDAQTLTAFLQANRTCFAHLRGTFIDSLELTPSDVIRLGTWVFQEFDIRMLGDRPEFRPVNREWRNNIRTLVVAIGARTVWDICQEELHGLGGLIQGFNNAGLIENAPQYRLRHAEEAERLRARVGTLEMELRAARQQGTTSHDGTARSQAYVVGEGSSSGSLTADLQDGHSGPQRGARSRPHKQMSVAKVTGAVNRKDSARKGPP